MDEMHVIDGKAYVEVGRPAEVGDKAIILDEDTEYYGRIGKIEFVEDIGVSVNIDDDLDYYPFVLHADYHVLEPLEYEPTVDTTQASPQVIDMLANLARRMTSLESQLSAAQRNIETWAEQTESNSEDIRTLDERTQPVCTSPKSGDMVEHPPHYNAGKYEVIDVIDDVLSSLERAGASGFETYCIGNVLKYVMRYRHKNGVEDLKKAVWYAKRVIESLGEAN
jgi:hypothetical protein